MSSEDSKNTPEKMSSRKFVGLWTLGGFILGVILGNPTPGDFGSMVSNKIGTGLPFALVGAALGGVVQYFFRSEKK